MSRKMGSRISVLFAVMLLFQTLLSSFAYPSQIFAAGYNDSVFTGISAEETGEQQDTEDGTVDLVDVQINWSIEHLEIKPGNTDSLQLSEDLSIEADQTGRLLTEEGVDIGEYKASINNTVMVTFEEATEEYPDSKGVFVVEATQPHPESEDVSSEEVAEEGDEDKPTTKPEEEIDKVEETPEEDEESSEEIDKEENSEEDPPVQEENEEYTDEKALEDKSIEDKEDKERTVSTFAELQENIFTFSSLTLNGEKIEDGEVIDVSDGTEVQVEFTWDTIGLDVFAGDTATMQLPDVFLQVSTPSAPIMVEGVQVGTYSIVDGELQFVFNENIEGQEVHNGVVGLKLQFNLEKFQGNIEQEIQFHDEQESTFTVIARPGGDISGITKEGHPDRERDAREITWTIDVMNDHEEPITEATLRDILPEGLGEPRDFAVNELTVGINGDKHVGAGVEANPQVSGDEFSIDFESIAPFQGYRIQYTTTIEDYTIDSFTNDALFSYGDTELPAKATVDKLERSNPIQKEGSYNWENHQIDWEIIVNESGGEIDEAIVDDILPDELSLSEGSIEVYRYDSNWQNRERVQIDSDDFPINLGQVNANEIYKIEFSTDIDWTVVNGGEYQHHNQFTNQTELYDGNIKIGEAETTVDHWRDTLLEKSGASNVDYDNNTLTWTVEVNNAKHPLDNVVVNDVIPEGLSIDEGDIVITGEDDEPYKANNVSVNGQNIQIDLGNIGTETITITYTTTIEKFTIDEFDNKASLDGDGIGEDKPEDNDVIYPPANSFAKDFAGINYNEKTIDWNLTVNPIREAITELTIADTFPNKGMILLPDTLEITVDGKEVEEGFTLTRNEEDGETGYHKGFIIQFDNELLPLNAQMEISYQTSYDPQLDVDGNTLDPHVGGEGQDRVYENHAQFTGKTEQTEFDEGRDAKTTVREDSWNSGYKEGQLVHENEDENLIDGWISGSERKIAWQLYTNYQQQDLGTGVVIEDTLDYEGTIDEGSVVVSVYNVAANGDTTITDEVLSNENYTVNYDGDSFTLTFNDDFKVDERYVVQFTTTVPNISQPNYTNNATVKVGDNDYPYEGTVNYDKHDHFLKKGTVGLDGNDVFTGEEIDWQVTLNESLSVILRDVAIIDTISPGLVYVEDSLKLATIDGTVFEEGEDYSLDVEINEDGETTLAIELLFDLEETLVLNYTTVVTETDGEVNNTVSFEGTGIEEENVTTEQLNAREFSWVDGEFNPERGAFRVTKLDAEDNQVIENNEATFILEFDLNGERVQFGEEFTTENGILEIGNLPLRTYYLKEVEAPTGYIIDEEEKTIDVTEPYGTEEHVYEVEFTNTKMKTDISVTKEWDDENNQDGHRPGSIEVQLTADGEAIDDAVEILSVDNEWSYTWTDLDEYHSNGNLIEYSVEEINVPEDYESTSEVGNNGEITITNSYEPETTEIAVNKVWNDEENQDNVRPNNVTVNLLADGEIERQTVLNKDNEWQYLFTDLPVYEDGREIKYTITEDAVTHYSTDVESTGTEEEAAYTITNNYTPEETSVTVTKSWDDDNNRDGNRPTEIQLQLLANGEPHGDSVTVDQSDWTYTWSNLPANKNGEPIEYTVEEVDVPEGYTESVNDNDHGNIIITNSYEPETTEIAVNKEWDDADNQDGNRPSGVTVNLLGNGEVVKTTVLDEENEWNHTFTNLPVYENGEKITYRVTENNVEGYTPDIKSDPNNENGFVITNSYTPEETSVTVTKGWNDVNNQDNKRPESIDVQLTADGEAIGDTQTLSEENNWTYTWDELDLNADGKPIDYSVEEVNVPEGYTSSINDNDHGNIIITNNYTPEVTEIPVKKVWDDDDDRDRVRPNNVTVTLLADGEIERQAVLNEAGDWEHTFKNLPVYENGTKINYSLTENTVLEYSTSVQPDENGFVVTNSYTPDETTATVTKNWNDAENQDGVRPESIEVQLLANDEPTGDPVEIHAEDGWTYTWEGLPLNADGEPIKYSVEELNVPEGYEMTVNDEDHGNLILTNNHTPEEINISGTKTWDDADNQDGIRPTTITVNLFANDDFVKSVDVTEADDWSYNFNNLPKYEAGEEITYTITEDEVEGYETEIDGFDITNTHTPEVIDVNGTKTWDDADNQDGIRPDTITVNLLADGEQVASTNVTEEDNWSYSFTDLPKFEAGEEIVYTITENTVEDYTQTIDGFDITNEYTPGETAVTVTKDWDDANNQDGIRPETIEVQLTADGDDQGEPVELSEDNNWTHTWTELDEKAAGESIVYSVVEVTELPEYETSVNDENHGNIIITNSYTPETTEVAGTKTWDDADNQDGIRPESITVNLLSNGNPIKSVEVTAEEDWSYQFNNLPKYEAGEEIAYTITEDAVEGYEASVDGFDLTNTHTPEVIELNGTKTWDDADNQDGIRPASITVNLHANGDEEAIDSVEVTADDNWEYSFDNLPKFEAGEKITYTITEDVVEGYNTTINGFNITNSYTPETTEVAGTKTWDDADNQDGIRPASITVNLVANDEKVDSVDVTEETNWSYHFDNLPKYEAGEEIVYTITEQPVEGYDTIINGFNITNSHTPELTEVTGTKTWNDGDNQDGIRPDSITVNLLANGEPVDSVEVSAEDNWNYSFTDLPKYENGKEIKYTVTENTVKDYSQEINGYDITNHYTPGETAVTVTKHWDDAANQDGKRLEVIEVRLTANGDPVGDPVELSEANNWTHTWTELDEKAAGEAIVYSVEELTEVPEYDTEINDENHGSIVITNSYTPEVIEVSGEKTWKDANNQDGIRPDSIMVNLLANGEPVDSVEVSAEDDWSYSFIDLPKYENGKEIKYTITENTVTDYSQEIDRYDITNHYTPGETAVSVTKHWDDAGNQDGKRLDAIEVQLTANGDPVGDPVKLSEENNWTYTWTELDEKAAGETIIYSVIELTEVPEYDTAVNDADHGNIIITNAYTPEVIEVSGEKTWDDADNQDGIRPDTITVNLYGDGEFIASVEVTEADDWRYSFTDLPKYSEGTEIEYTITEVPVEGYETEISGFDITNIHEPEVVDVSGTKTWNDENDQDGVRPDSITVNLLANGELVDSIEVTAENDWSYEFSDLPKYENGVEIKYTITENTVADYSQEIDGYDITNHYTPGETAVTVTKQWDDANNQDGKRLDAIEVQLTANDDPIGDPVELSAANNWTYTWTALDEKAAGETIVYSVIELTEAADYVTEINDENHGNLIITNSYTPETMDVSGEKTWLDGDNETNDRPEEITVNLLANGEVLTSTNVTEADDWSYQFTDLPKYSAGEEITYTVEEVPVEGYETIIDGYNMTNLRVGTIDVEGVKTWVGDSEEVRPESITVHLLQNDVVIDTEEVTVADDWKYSFTDLPAFDEVGAAYVYTIEEEAVEGYETTINGYNITNTYTVEVDEGGEDPISGDEKDKDKTPSTPVDKEDTETLAGVDSKDLDPGKGSKLPKTATNIFNLLAIGIGLIVLAIAITIYRRRKAA